MLNPISLYDIAEGNELAKRDNIMTKNDTKLKGNVWIPPRRVECWDAFTLGM